MPDTCERTPNPDTRTDRNEAIQFAHGVSGIGEGSIKELEAPDYPHEPYQPIDKGPGPDALYQLGHQAFEQWQQGGMMHSNRPT